jgi:hypothetical protein
MTESGRLPKPVSVSVAESYLLNVTFNNGEIRRFDVSPYLDYPAFEALKSRSLFEQARVAHHTVVWNEEVDIAPESLYLESTQI